MSAERTPRRPPSECKDPALSGRVGDGIKLLLARFAVAIKVMESPICLEFIIARSLALPTDRPADITKLKERQIELGYCI